MFRRRRRVAETEETAPQPQGRYVREEVERPPPRRPLLWPWLLLLLLLVGVGLAGAYLSTRDEDAGGSENRVPNVVGETVTDAVRELGQRGYAADVRARSPGRRSAACSRRNRIRARSSTVASGW
jgi:hypothetical protein